MGMLSASTWPMVNLRLLMGSKASSRSTVFGAEARPFFKSAYGLAEAAPLLKAKVRLNFLQNLRSCSLIRNSLGIYVFGDHYLLIEVVPVVLAGESMCTLRVCCW